MTEMEKLFEKMLNMELTNEEMFEQCRNVAHEPMTNEEYLRSANVNDMARCIATKLLELARHEYGIYDVVDYATIFEWLKEKHE